MDVQRVSSSGSNPTRTGSTIGSNITRSSYGESLLPERLWNRVTEFP